MKKNSMLFFLLLPLALGAQLPYTPLDTVVMTNGRVVEAYIVGDRSQRLFITKAADLDNTVFEVPKNAIASSTRHSWVYGPGFPSIDGAYNVQAVVDMPGMDSGALYTNLRAWLAKTYNDSEAVLEVNEATAGMMIGRGNTLLSATRLHYALKLECRDGRYRYSFYDLSFSWDTIGEYPFITIYGPDKNPNKAQVELLVSTLTHFANLAASMQAYLTTASTDDW